MIRVLLVDDHQIVRSGVRLVLEATGRFNVVGEAAGVREALDQARRLRPEVVVLDLTLRDGSGLDVIADLWESGARVVILSMQDEPAYARKAFELGAQGYVVKDAADDELAGAIDAVLADRIYVHPALAARLVMNEPADDLTAGQHGGSGSERDRPQHRAAPEQLPASCRTTPRNWLRRTSPMTQPSRPSRPATSSRCR